MTNTTEAALRECPFCGTSEHLHVSTCGSMTSDMPDRPHRVVCDHIDHDQVQGPVEYGRFAAIAAWNTRLSHSTPGNAEVRGYRQAISDVLAILRPNWGVDQQTFRCNGELLKDGNGNSKFFATVDVERAVVERIKKIEGLSTPSGRAQGEGDETDIRVRLGDEIAQSLVRRGHAACGQEAVRIAATPPSVPAQQGWLPIETFSGQPTGQSNSVIVAVTGGGREPVVGEAWFDPEKYGGTWWWAGTESSDYHANPIDDIMHGTVTHWQPLPAAPPAQDQGDKQ